MDLRAGAEAIVDRCVVVTELFVSVREPRRVAEGEGRRKGVGSRDWRTRTTFCPSLETEDGAKEREEVEVEGMRC